MQYYTKQQLQGSVRYAPNCLVGNWNEDVEVQDIKLKDFHRRREEGSLKLDGFQRRMSIALHEYPLTKIRDDEYVHFGDLVQIAQATHGAALSGDVMDKDVRTGEHSYAVTATSALSSPCARNTFLFTKYKPKKNSAYDTFYNDDTLHYGQKIRLVANPAMCGEPLDVCGGRHPLCLFSRPISTTHAAKFSRHQLVGLTPHLGYETAWEVRPTNPEEWIASQGMRVPAMVPVTLVHCATKQTLRVEDVPYPNDFGIEQEVSAHSLLSTSKKNVLVHTFKGELRGSMDKPVSSPNHWVIVTGDKVEVLPEPECKALEVQEVLAHIRHTLSAVGTEMFSLKKKLLMMDKDGNGSVQRQEFLIGLRCSGINLEEGDLSLLVEFFAAQDMDCIDVRAFFSELELLESL